MNPTSTEEARGQRLEWAHGGPYAPREPRTFIPTDNAGRPGPLTPQDPTRPIARTRRSPRRRHQLLGLGRSRSAPWPQTPSGTCWRPWGSRPTGPEEQQRSLAETRLAPWRRLLPPVLVVREGQESRVDVHVPHGSDVRVWIDAEDGSRHEAAQRENWDQPVDVDGVLTGRATFAIPGGLGLGWHTLQADADGATAQCPLVVTPGRLQTPRCSRNGATWGLTAQLYSVRSSRSWGIGDFADLADLAAVAGEQGARLRAGQPAARRRAGAAGRGLPVPARPPGASSTRCTCGWRKSPNTATWTRPAGPRWHAWPGSCTAANRSAGPPGPQRQLRGEARGPGTACSRSAAARPAAGSSPTSAPSRGRGSRTLRCGARSPKSCRRRRRMDRSGCMPRRSPYCAEQRPRLAGRIEFHRWLQWLCDQQLEAAQRSARQAGMEIGVVHDLAVGVKPGGADAWTLAGVLARGVSVGAPPDMFNQQGQNWSQPPWHPGRLAESGYAAYRDMLRTVLRHAGGIRVDHILGPVPAVVDPGGRRRPETAPTSTTTTRRSSASWRSRRNGPGRS